VKKIPIYKICFPASAVFILVVALHSGTLPALADSRSELVTYYEQSGFRETPRYDETVRYCKSLANASPWLQFSFFGESPQGRGLPLLTVDKDRRFKPAAAKKRKAVLLIQACIHAGESDGKDAGLMLLRDIAVQKNFPGLLDHVTVLFIPIFNVDGHEHFGPYNRINQNGPKEMGWRVTAQNLNLNRDYLKADSSEMKSWLRLFQKWLPDFFIDCHVTDGADFQYAITYALEIRGNMDADLTAWVRNNYLDQMEKLMEGSGFPVSPYVFFRKRHDVRSGLVTWVAGPRFSQGYTAIQNRPGLLIETHMLKDYKTRVTGTYEMLKNTLVILNSEYDRLMRLNREADARTAEAEFRKEPFALRFRPLPDSTVMDFLGVDYEKTHSGLTGGDWFKFGSDPVTYKIPFFGRWEPSVTVELPEAYIIPPQWTDVIERLALHGIKTYRLKHDARIKVNSYRFDNASWNNKPYEGRFPLKYDVEEYTETRVFPRGSAIIDMNQRSARAAAHILEPHGPDSYVFWGFFNTIFEQKEYTEDYVMEEMARQMLDEDPGLRDEFDQWREDNEDSAENPRQILNWFYMHTPYWDERINVYPVGRIMNRTAVDELADMR